MKKFRFAILAITLLLCLVCLAACGDRNEGGQNTSISDVYEKYVSQVEENGEEPLSYEAWLASLRGEKGDTGAPGRDGIGISKVEKISSDGLTDTYRITFTDNTTYCFTVRNGRDGTDGKDGTNGKDGTDGKDGINGTDGKDGVDGKDGTDGLTPTIGENGNWWIGDRDTGVPAGNSDSTPESDSRVLSDWQKIISIAMELSYETRTIGGQSGFVVTGFTLHFDETQEDYAPLADLMTYEEYTDLAQQIKAGSRRLDVVIPNYVGRVPVIGIRNTAFKSKTDLRSVSLSENTTYLESNCFADCTNLETVDFNNCRLKSIPSYCFSNTKLTEVMLPGTVTRLFSKAFYNCRLLSVNYDRVVYYGDECLNKLAMDWLYLKKNVEYVGRDAFSSLFVYTEHEVIPAAWDSTPVDCDDQYIGVCPGVLSSGEYLYSVNATGLSVNRYLGEEKKLVVPSQIDGMTVTAIGYGFCSRSNARINGMDDPTSYPGILQLKQYDEIVIPSTVTKIAANALVTYDTMIFIPASVTSMWYGVGRSHLQSDDPFDGNAPSYLAFEAAALPAVFSLSSGGAETDYKSKYESNLLDDIRHSFSCDYTKMVYDTDTKTYYRNNGTSYSLMAVMNGCGRSLSLTGTYNDLPVTMILPYAVSQLHEVKYVSVTGAYARIRTNAFRSLPDCVCVYVGKNVELVNANAFTDCGDDFCIGSAEKPEDWDTLWCGGKTVDTSCQPFEVNDEYLYYIDETGNAVLYKYLGEVKLRTIVHLPSAIDGHTVNRVKTNCFIIDTTTGGSSQSGYLFYIPSTIEVLEEKSIYFNYSSYDVYCTVYTDAAATPTGWQSDWMCTSRYSYSTIKSYGYFKMVYDRYVDGLHAYRMENGLLYLTDYLGDTSKVIVIPAEIQGVPVFGIDAKYVNVSERIRVVIPSSITVLYENAIYSTFSTSYQYSITVFLDSVNLPATWSKTGCVYRGSYGFGSSYVKVYYIGQWKFADNGTITTYFD